MKRRLLLYGNVLISFDFFLYVDHLYLLLRYNLFVVLNPLLDRVVVLLDDFPRNGLNNSTFLVFDYFPFDGHLLHIGPILILDHLLLVRNVIDSAFAFISHQLPLTTSSFLTWDETKRLLSLLTLDIAMLLGLGWFK